MKQLKKNNKKGFTIVELVIVIAVIAILAAVLIPTFSGVVDNANKSAAMQEARNSYVEYLAAHPTANIDYVENDKGTYYDVNDDFNTVDEPTEGTTILTIGTCLETGNGKCEDCDWTLTVVETEDSTETEDEDNQ